jgi:hypothetical protein
MVGKGMNGGILTNGKAREATINIVVTRADGSIEDRGVVAYWHKNPLRRLAWRVKQWTKR